MILNAILEYLVIVYLSPTQENSHLRRFVMCFGHELKDLKFGAFIIELNDTKRVFILVYRITKSLFNTLITHVDA